MHKKSEIIYKDDQNLTDEFNENKVFKNSYFYKTHIQWNNLPLDIKVIEDYDIFMVALKNHIWDTLLWSNEDNESYDDPLCAIPGD